MYIMLIQKNNKLKGMGCCGSGSMCLRACVNVWFLFGERWNANVRHIQCTSSMEALQQ